MRILIKISSLLDKINIKLFFNNNTKNLPFFILNRIKMLCKFGIFNLIINFKYSSTLLKCT